MNHYFADDGNYGDAEGLVVVKTEGWTEDDWDLIFMAQDWDRPRVARDIASQKLAESE
jgi:hypothetical protein